MLTNRAEKLLGQFRCIGKRLVPFFHPAYLVDAEVSIGVEVVVPWCHFLRADELGDLASAGTGGQGRYMRRVGDAGHMVGSRHWFGQWGGLGWLREGGRDGLLPLLRRKETGEGRDVCQDLQITHKNESDGVSGRAMTKLQASIWAGLFRCTVAIYHSKSCTSTRCSLYSVQSLLQQQWTCWMSWMGGSQIIKCFFFFFTQYIVFVITQRGG